MAIVVPDIEVAHRILLLNTEKAHNLRERSLEVIRLAELLAETGGPARAGLRDRVRGAGAADARALLPGERPLRRRGVSSGAPAGREVAGGRRCPRRWRPGASGPARAGARRGRTEAMKKLKERGFESPYLRPFVVARINPLRFKRGGNRGRGRDDRDRCSPRLDASTPVGCGPTRWRGREELPKNRPIHDEPAN